jgi:hypothetical protein
MAEGEETFPMYKLKKAFPFITATFLSVAVWIMFAMWIVIVYESSYDLMTIIVGTFLVMVFAGSTTWHSIKAYREWRKTKNGEKVALGVLIGMGMMLVILGFLGWVHTNYCLERLSYIFELVGIDTSSHYLIADLNKLMRIYVFFIAIGFVSLLGGGYVLKKRTKGE